MNTEIKNAVEKEMLKQRIATAQNTIENLKKKIVVKNSYAIEQYIEYEWVAVETHISDEETAERFLKMWKRDEPLEEFRIVKR